MKTKFLLITLLSVIMLPVCALTVSETTSTNYMKNNGYSNTTIDSVQFSKAAANGEKYVSYDEQKYGNCSAVTKWVRRFFSYLDPALDQDDILKHDIKMTPRPNDL